MGVMLPYNYLCALTMTLQKSGEQIYCLCHVAVAQIPGFYLTAEHRAVILFSVLHNSSIMLGVEELILLDAPIATCEIGGSPAQFDELVYYLLFTRPADAEARFVTIYL